MVGGRGEEDSLSQDCHSISINEHTAAKNSIASLKAGKKHVFLKKNKKMVFFLKKNVFFST